MNFPIVEAVEEYFGPEVQPAQSQLPESIARRNVFVVDFTEGSDELDKVGVRDVLGQQAESLVLGSEEEIGFVLNEMEVGS